MLTLLAGAGTLIGVWKSGCRRRIRVSAEDILVVESIVVGKRAAHAALRIAVGATCVLESICPRTVNASFEVLTLDR